jgi:hypothetical protein
MLALPSLVGLLHLQRQDSTEQALNAAVPGVPQQLGSQHCESLFSSWRFVSGQNTGSISSSEALAKADTAITIADMESAGTFTLPTSRKAAKHKQHPTAAYTVTVEDLLEVDIDINRSIQQGYLMCRDILTDLGYTGLLRAHAKRQSAVQEMLTATTSPVRHSCICSGRILKSAPVCNVLSPSVVKNLHQWSHLSHGAE